jgi:hypothetical protein
VNADEVPGARVPADLAQFAASVHRWLVRAEPGDLCVAAWPVG